MVHNIALVGDLSRMLTGLSSGDVVHLNAFGTPVIILGTHEAAIDLLDKRAANYSDRKLSSMAEL